MTDIRTLSGRAEAQSIHEHLLIAFWQHETPEQPGYHLNTAHDQFMLLAEQLGYSVQRITSGAVVETPVSQGPEGDGHDLPTWTRTQWQQDAENND